jgi:hypothetical protein
MPVKPGDKHHSMRFSNAGLKRWERRKNEGEVEGRGEELGYEWKQGKRSDADHRRS